MTDLDAAIAQHTSLVAEGSGVFTHPTTRQEFVYIPAGAFVMGMAPDELLGVLRAIDHDPRSDVWRQMIGKAYTSARPAHGVTVPAFLCGRFPMTGLGVRAAERAGAGAVEVGKFAATEEDDATVRLSREAAQRVLAALGWSAMSEAQWEYVARAGGRDVFVDGEAHEDRIAEQLRDTRFKRTSCNAFGVWGLAFGEWLADDAHDSYHHAPTDGAAWGTSLGSIRGGGLLHAPWQSPEEAISGYVAMRSAANLAHPYVLRPTIALPFLSAKLRAPVPPDDRSFKDIVAVRRAEISVAETREREREKVEAARRAEARRVLSMGSVHAGTVRTVGEDGVYVIRLEAANGILRAAGTTLAVGDTVRVRVIDETGTPQVELYDNGDVA